MLFLAIALTATFALALSLLTDWIRATPLREPLLALLFGIAIGPVGLGWIRFEEIPAHEAVLEQTARLALALVIVGVGLHLPRQYFRRHAGSLFALIGGGILVMWLVSAGLVWAWLGLPPLVALLIGAALSPTDPVLAAGVVTGKEAKRDLPARLRHLLSAESGVRHGLALTLLMLPAAMLTRPAAEGVWHWLSVSLPRELVTALVLGALLGWVFGRLERLTRRRELSGPGPLFATILLLALSSLSLVELAGGDGLLGALMAGITYARLRQHEDGSDRLEVELSRIDELLKRVVQIPVFVLLGLALPWAAWAGLGWPALGLVASLLLLRRLPLVLALRPWLPSLRNRSEAVFVGWFGPIGVGALLLSMLARAQTGLELAWVVGSLVVAASIVINDLTTTPLSRWLARRAEPDERRLRSTTIPLPQHQTPVPPQER